MSTVLVYADRADVREHVRNAIGRLPAADLGPIEFVEATDAPEAIGVVDHHEADLCVFDAEATPSGGMGLCRQLKNEVTNCPPTILLVARPDDRWLATWSQADAVVTHPIDPGLLTEAVVTLLRARAGGAVARRPLTGAQLAH
ncbi:response regulator receiver protein [Frankia casuarinae]|jgi:CheY-like chemotaxis protein|uniref:Response regulator receiver protein n=1 Tax=Frankia casuarinae (strain DSM 45818 / CECT 9043 / HFP020203 / CcI3) TaxID=106370 RepID=Q2J8C2_FRACC|nr:MULTISPECIES: response regulator [Frankia]ABD12470.1 response regulator receiver protein [Frankia casuarinae]ETA01445.1 response regulator receiver protein [Frankia sp. CcI6]EYT91951.1 response regulator receiver protein [Frankia casuarinae]KDA44708.1 response regulator receiver protein [Frankia sp. BMG5.23]KEZ36390.1 response regulator receiver protein [Frankia sp. CeD]